MPHILDDLNRVVCPSFEDPEWECLRQSMVNGHQGNHPITLEEAAQQIKDAWSCENQCKIATWDNQVMQDQTEHDKQDRALRDKQDAIQAQLEKEAEDMHKDVEKKKPKLNPFDSKCHIEKWIALRPSSYALNKLNNLEYVELDYFATKGCKEAAANNNKSVSHDTLTFTQLGDTFVICPMATMRPSRHIRNDENLTWEEMLNAKSIMLHFMSKSDMWPIPHTRSITGFFYNIKNHLRKAQKNGKKALMLYQSQAQCKWFDALKHNKGFNLKLIQDELL